MNLILGLSKVLVKTICSSFRLNGQVSSHSNVSATGQHSSNETKRSSRGMEASFSGLSSWPLHNLLHPPKALALSKKLTRSARELGLSEHDAQLCHSVNLDKNCNETDTSHKTIKLLQDEQSQSFVIHPWNILPLRFKWNWISLEVIWSFADPTCIFITSLVPRWLLFPLGWRKLQIKFTLTSHSHGTPLHYLFAFNLTPMTL